MKIFAKLLVLTRLILFSPDQFRYAPNTKWKFHFALTHLKHYLKFIEAHHWVIHSPYLSTAKTKRRVAVERRSCRRRRSVHRRRQCWWVVIHNVHRRRMWVFVKLMTSESIYSRVLFLIQICISEGFSNRSKRLTTLMYPMFII